MNVLRRLASPLPFGRHCLLLGTIVFSAACASFAQTVNIGTSSSATAKVNFTSTVTLNSSLAAAIQVVTQGAANLDFQYASGGTCAAGATFNNGQSCTVNYTFAPTAPGPRYGAVTLYSNDVTPVLIGTAFISGVGVGPQAVVLPGMQTNAVSFSGAIGTAIDGNGNLFVVSRLSDSVIEYPKSGSTYGAGVTIASGLNSPYGIAIDGAGNVFVADTFNARILELVLSNGTYTQTVAVSSGFSGASTLAIDKNENLYIADVLGNTLVKATYSPTGYTTTQIDVVHAPYGIAVDANGDIFVGEAAQNDVKEYVPGSGGYTGSVLFTGLYAPTGIALDGGGNVYIVNFNGDTIVKESYSGGTYTPTILPVTGFYNPYGLTLDASGNIYISDTGNNRVVKLDVGDSFALPAFVSTPAGTTSSDSPKAVTVANIGNASLTFAVPTSGANPAVTSSFALTGASTCPQLTSGSTATTLVAGTSCTDLISFTPASGGPITGTLVTTDNSLSVTGSTQTVNLSGAGTSTQTITFPQPTTPVAVNATFTLTATSSAGAGYPVSYSISGPATLAGSVVTYTGAGTVTITASQAGDAYYSAASSVSRTVTVQGTPAITWHPSTQLGYSGLPIGSSVLDATATTAGTFTYTAALLPSGTPSAVSASTVLAAGSYTLTANFSPSDITDFTSSSASIGYTVQSQTIFVINSAGTLTTLQDNGSVQSNMVSGGGRGVAVDGTGAAWSVNSAQTSVAKFSDSGSFSATYSGGGTSGATALAVDGAGLIWIVDGGGVSAFTNAGSPVFASAVSTTSGISSPGSISVDTAGSLWIANAGNNTVTEVIGVASPVVTPTVTAVSNSNPGTRP